MAASALAAPLARHTLKRPFPGVYVCVTRWAAFSNGSRTGYRAKSMNTCAGTSPPLTHPNNLDGNDRHGGIPVGAVQIESTQFQSFFTDLIHRVGDRDATFQNINSKAFAFRGVEVFIGPSTYDQSQFQNTIDIGKTNKKRSRQLLVHLPTSVAAALDGGHPELMQFLNSHKSTYLPGFRRHPNHPDATRAKRHAMISPYVMPKRAVDVLHRDTDTPSKFTYAEFFAGIGGFRLGLDAIGGSCIFANEVDPYAASIYRRNFSLNGHDAKCPLLEADILDLCPIRDNLPIADVDILCGGFPCQSFSVRGDQRALKDARGQGQLYQELCRMLLSARPKSFIFENVPGLVSLDGGWVGRDGDGDGDQRQMKAGRIMAYILAAFESCGYNIEWNVIDAAHWVPQRRKRVYIVGIRNDITATFSWEWYNDLVSSGGGDKRILRDVLEPKDIANQYKLSDSQWKAVKRIQGDLYENTAFDTQTKSPTLISSYRKGNSFTTKYIFEEADGTQRHRPRYLSPREAARLQGFPEWFTVPTAISSDTEHAHFYKGIGNAVVPPLIEKVGMELVRCIKGVP